MIEVITKGKIKIRAITQRQKERATGGTVSERARPKIKLPDQKRTVRVRRR